MKFIPAIIITLFLIAFADCDDPKKAVERMTVLGCLGMVVVAHGGRAKSVKATKSATKKRRNKRTTKPRKAKVAKRRKPAVAPKLSDTQLMWDRLYVHGRDYGSAPQKSNMPL